ncbi:MAG: type II toxin-antitoxin system HicB family antitoxin [Microcystaceae cyanobacterium]
MNQYSLLIQWSEEDQLFLVTIPEFEEDQLFLVTIPEFSEQVIMPCTYGKTREEAIRNGEEVIEMYLEAWQNEGQTIPAPKTLQVA